MLKSYFDPLEKFRAVGVDVGDVEIIAMNFVRIFGILRFESQEDAFLLF